ncbi:MAG TPA: hypothetical protein VM166_13910 [Gemmatimonadaceae bacterium]|nr:hypothetical protein [Gemmatimonadaceae bacterium]
MTCQECLAVLATGSLRELTPDSPVMSHAADCPDCARVTTQLRERESYAADLFNTLPSMSNPVSIAETAAGMGRRRRKGRIVVMITGTALAATIWIAAATTVIPALNRSDIRVASDLRTETIQLSCLSPKQAGDIISPYVRSHGSTFYLPSSGLSAITVRGTIKELRVAHELISQFENDPSAACHLSPSVGVILAPPTKPTPTAPKPAP